MFCTKCGSEIGSPKAFCTGCGTSLSKQGSTATKVLKWGGVGCGLLLGLLVVALVLATIVSAIDPDSSTDNPMSAAVHVLPGGVSVINNNAFPWYGLIITVNDQYSTRYHFGDPNYSFLRPDSIVEPGELISMDVGNFVDKDGKEFEAILYTVTVRRVKLEAKTKIDGSYNLELEIATADANATPTAERRPTIRVYFESGSGQIRPGSIPVAHHEPKYDEVLEFVSDYPRNAFGSYILPPDAYRELQVILGLALP